MRKQKYIGKTEQVLCEIYFLLLQKVVSKNKLPRSLFYIVKKITTIYKRLFTLCSYLKTKESYDRWVTRRVWGFRQQISKEKYLKMSVGNIRKLQENTAALYTERKTLRVSAIRRSGYVYPEKLKRPPLPSGCETSGCEMSADGIPSRVE